MIKLRALVLALLVSTPLLAQEERRGFIGLDIGPSQPFGAFASRRSLPDGGNARAGYTSTLVNVGWRLGEHWGIAGMLAYSEFVMRNTDGIDDDWWQVTFLTVGPMYTIPVSERTAIDLKGTVGVSVMLPVLDALAGDADYAHGIGFAARATLRHDVSPRWAVFTEAGVQATKAEYADRVQQAHAAFVGGFGIAYRPRWGGVEPWR